MIVLFEALRGVFLTLTVLLIIFLSIGARVFDAPTFTSINATMMPAYLIFTGIIIGYILNLLAKEGDESSEELEKKGSLAYIQGIVIGIFLALLYIFVG